MEVINSVDMFVRESTGKSWKMIIEREKRIIDLFDWGGGTYKDEVIHFTIKELESEESSGWKSTKPPDGERLVERPRLKLSLRLRRGRKVGKFWIMTYEF